MRYFYYTFLATVITISSCKNNEAETAQPDTRTIVPITQQEPVNPQTSQTTVDSGHNLFHEKKPTPTASSVVVEINPEHGQPNHRCDIPVGAPLNGSANNTTNTTVTEPAKAE